MLNGEQTHGASLITTLATALATVAGFAGIVAAAVRSHRGEHETLSERIREQELKCAATSSGVLERLNGIDKKQDDQTDMLKTLLGRGPSS